MVPMMQGWHLLGLEERLTPYLNPAPSWQVLYAIISCPDKDNTVMLALLVIPMLADT